jgi:hypothetical protein
LFADVLDRSKLHEYCNKPPPPQLYRESWYY